MARLVAAFGALAIFGALGIQLGLLIANFRQEGGTALEGVWRFVGYFTVLTNILVALVLARAALRPEARNGLNAQAIELTATVAILFVGVVYNVLLAPLWNPQGLQKLADLALHNAAPLFMLAFWLLRPHGQITWRAALTAAAWPLGYVVYAMARGALDGFYAYYFLDPTQAGLGDMAVNIGALTLAFVAGALLLTGVDAAMARRAKPSR